MYISTNHVEMDTSKPRNKSTSNENYTDIYINTWGKVFLLMKIIYIQVRVSAINGAERCNIFPSILCLLCWIALNDIKIYTLP